MCNSILWTVCRLNFKITKSCFESYIQLSSSGKKGKRTKNLYDGQRPKEQFHILQTALLNSLIQETIVRFCMDVRPLINILYSRYFKQLI
jgi:hypothetical protein